MTHRKLLKRHRNRSGTLTPGAAWRTPAYWPCDVRCIEGVTLARAFCTELENLFGDVKENGTIGRTERPKVPMRHSRGGLLRSSAEAG